MSCQDCGYTFEASLKIDKRDELVGADCEKCLTGKLFRAVNTVAFGDPVRMGFGEKNSGGIRDVLKKIHEKAPGSRLDQTSTINKI